MLRWKDNIKMDLSDLRWHALDSRKEQLTDSCANSSKFPGSIKFGKFLD
jgi:hypothetical protein